MQQASFQPDQRNNLGYVRVVLAHKDWLADSLSSAHLVEILHEELLNLKSKRAHVLGSLKQKPEVMLEVMADVLTESIQGIESMLWALEHDKKQEVLNGLSTLAQATSALLEAEKHL